MLSAHCLRLSLCHMNSNRPKNTFCVFIFQLISKYFRFFLFYLKSFNFIWPSNQTNNKHCAWAWETFEEFSQLNTAQSEQFTIIQEVDKSVCTAEPMIMRMPFTDNWLYFEYLWELREASRQLLSTQLAPR